MNAMEWLLSKHRPTLGHSEGEVLRDDQSPPIPESWYLTYGLHTKT